jgi:beta-phosphoglucomutase-like phosphatase (HAD superfamily)
LSAAAPIRAVVFDFDGLIADTESLHFETFLRTLHEAGVMTDPASGNTRFLGRHDRACFRQAFEEAGRALSETECERLVRRKTELYRAGIPQVRIFAGARELIAGAKARAAITIASGGRRGDLERILTEHGLIGDFPWMVTADEVHEPKPHPEVFLKALDGLRARGLRDLEPRECLVFEDSFHGVEAARRAGMRCAAVTHSVSAELLRAADWVIESLREWRWPEER